MSRTPARVLSGSAGRDHLQILRFDYSEACPRPVMSRPQLLHLAVEALPARAVQGSEGSIRRPVVHPEEIHDIRRRERIVQRVASPPGRDVSASPTEKRMEFSSHCPVLAKLSEVLFVETLRRYIAQLRGRDLPFRAGRALPPIPGGHADVVFDPVEVATGRTVSEVEQPERLGDCGRGRIRIRIGVQPRFQASI
jgi:hypothetical protein